MTICSRSGRSASVGCMVVGICIGGADTIAAATATAAAAPAANKWLLDTGALKCESTEE